MNDAYILWLCLVKTYTRHKWVQAFLDSKTVTFGVIIITSIVLNSTRLENIRLTSSWVSSNNLKIFHWHFLSRETVTLRQLIVRWKTWKSYRFIVIVYLTSKRPMAYSGAEIKQMSAVVHHSPATPNQNSSSFHFPLATNSHEFSHASTLSLEAEKSVLKSKTERVLPCEW